MCEYCWKCDGELDPQEIEFDEDICFECYVSEIHCRHAWLAPASVVRTPALHGGDLHVPGQGEGIQGMGG